MPQRLVVSFRGVIQPDPEGGARYLARALDLKKRAEALGATLSAWSAQTFSFDFDPDELEEAAALAVVALEGSAEERFSAGIAQGEMSIVGEGSFAVLSWGPALVTAVALARDARPGEALIDPDLFRRREVELTLLEGMVVDRRKYRLLIREDAAPSMMPPPSSVSFASTERVPGSAVDSARSRRAPTLPPPPSHPAGLLAALAAAESQRVPPSQAGSQASPPETGPGLSPEAAVLFAGPPRRRMPTLPSIPGIGGDAQPEPVVQLAKRALLQGDVAALEQLMTQLRETGEHSDLVERMTGLIALRRGATAEALRRLRDAAEAVREPAQKARARLAYGVALATAGRSEAALLEALEALSHARAAFDAQGERACAIFLARLSAASGHSDEASIWAAIAAHVA
jgi:hypothetical protein